MRNPPWDRDELVLALDLYLKSYPSIPSSKHKSIVELSNLLNTLSIHSKSAYGYNFRNTNSVSMKLANFSALDPRYEKKGLESGSKGDKIIWNEFFNNREQLHVLATSIKDNITNISIKETIHKEDIEEEFSEGKVLYKVHKTRERDRRLINKKKKELLKNNSSLSCEACKFDFFKVYGKIGKEYIEFHHNKPVSTLKPNEKTKLSDISILCANCHRMIHRSRPWITVIELKNKIKENKLL